MTRSILLPVLASGLLAVSLAGQHSPKRPPNQAAAYYQYGLSMLQQDPQKAGDAFYWAARIDPTWAQPLHAGRIAFLMGADDQFVIGYMDGKRSYTRSKDARCIDSLELRARMPDPFMERDLDKELQLRWLRALYDEDQKSDGGRTDAPPEQKAMLAVSERRFPDALNLYREALSQDRDHQAEIHEARARIRREGRRRGRGLPGLPRAYTRPGSPHRRCATTTGRSEHRRRSETVNR